MSTRVASHVLGMRWERLSLLLVIALWALVRVLQTNYAGLRETRVIEDFEGYVALGLGLNGSNCYRAFVLQNPTRLVVDIQTS